MALLRGAQKLRQITQTTPQPLSSLLRGFCSRNFSTESQQPPPPSDSSLPSPLPFNPSLPPPPEEGVVYAKLQGINENTLKTDIINMYESSRLTLNDIKVDYDRLFLPLAMALKFPSLSDFNNAFKENNRKGRWCRLDKVDRMYWDSVRPYDEKFVLLHGLSRQTNLDDVERFLSGCSYDFIDIFIRPSYPDPIKVAQVRFVSPIEAMNAVIQKNGSFCLNSRVFTRIIQ